MTPLFDAVPVVRLDDGGPSEIEGLLGAMQQAVVEHPVAAQSIVAGLVAEGRRFARTPEGRAWLDRIAGSELARQGRILWEASILSVLDERADPPMPSALVDAIFGGLMASDLELLLERTNPLAEDIG